MINKNYYFNHEQIPKLSTYVLEGNEERGAVLILPGGGYGYTSPREAEPIALQFNAAGYHAFVLDYSCAPKRFPIPQNDVANAMKLIYDKREEWKIDSNRIAICGFSAGGHLAASYGIYWKEFSDIKPNALILSYPVITTGDYSHKGSFSNLLGDNPDKDLIDKLSLEKHINETTPPTFIWHTLEDIAVPVENTLLFIQGLRRHNIPFECHIYPKGGHGLSLASEETSAGDPEKINLHVSSWIKLCIEWLNELFK